MDIREILQRFDFIRELPEREYARGVSSARLAKLAKGAWFYRQGAQVDRLALVGSGTLRVFRTGETGREITLYHVRAGETCLVNLLSVFLAREACASARAEGPVTAVLIPGEVGRAWLHASDTFRTFAFASVGQRLIDVMTLVEEVAFGKMDQRLAEFLRQQSAVGSRIEMTHEAIAAELGTAREVVSRLLASLAREGAIVLARGCIRVKRPELLLAERWSGPVTKSQTAPRHPR